MYMELRSINGRASCHLVDSSSLDGGLGANVTPQLFPQTDALDVSLRISPPFVSFCILTSGHHAPVRRDDIR